MRLIQWVLAVVLALGGGAGAASAEAPQFTPTGQFITPRAAPGAIFEPLNPHLAGDPGYTVGQASAVALSPDGRHAADPDQRLQPLLRHGRQAGAGDVEGVRVRLRRLGRAAGAAPGDPDSEHLPGRRLGAARAQRFYVSGGVDDWSTSTRRSADGFRPARTFKLGHAAGVGLAVKPEAGALAVSPDGGGCWSPTSRTTRSALIDLATGAVTEQDLRPGVIDPAKAGTPGGSFPRAVIWTSPTRAFVASERDREVIALDVTDGAITVGRPHRHHRPAGRPRRARDAPLCGARQRRPRRGDRRRADRTPRGRVRARRWVPARRRRWRGSAAPGPTAWRSPADGRTLYATNGGANDVAVIRLAPEAGGAPRGRPDPHRLVPDRGRRAAGRTPALSWSTARATPARSPTPAASTSASIRTTTTPAGRPTSTSGRLREGRLPDAGAAGARRRSPR